jgi:HlyD family secretion protein
VSRLKRNLMVGAGVLAVVVAAAIGLPRSNSPVPTLEIEPTRWVHRITADGELVAARNTPLIVTLQQVRRHHLVAWLIADGSLVSEGDTVARFDSTDFERDLEEGRAEGDIADARIAASLTQRDGTLHNLDHDAAVSRRELEIAERFQAKDDQLFSRMEIIESEIDSDLARHRTEHASANKQIQDELGRSDLDLLAIERRRADLKIDLAQQNLDSLELRAPHAGIVVLSRGGWEGETLRVGDAVYPGFEIATIPDLTRMEAEVFVLEADAGGLAEGQQATVVIEAHPETTFSARIKSVDPIAQPRRRNSPVQYFRTVLELEHTDPEIMKPGQTLTAEIILSEYQDAITVPRQALVEEDGHTVVYRRTRGGFMPVEITVGAIGLGRVVVEDGLAAGDEIALRDPTRQPRDEPADDDEPAASDLVGTQR